MLVNIAHMKVISNTKKSFLIDGPVGALEALIDLPEQPREDVVAVVCHPHSLHGGTMHNKVVHTIARAYKALDIIALRFNFRGVGASEGDFAKGIGETEDVLAVIAWLQARYPKAKLCLAGFSFGAFVAMRAAQRLSLVHLVQIAPPVVNFSFQPLAAPACPWIVVQGEQDEVVAAEAVYAWLSEFSLRPRLIKMSGAGHFFHGSLIELKDQLCEAMNETL